MCMNQSTKCETCKNDCQAQRDEKLLNTPQHVLSNLSDAELRIHARQILNPPPLLEEILKRSYF